MVSSKVRLSYVLTVATCPKRLRHFEIKKKFAKVKSLALTKINHFSVESAIDKNTQTKKKHNYIYRNWLVNFDVMTNIYFKKPYNPLKNENLKTFPLFLVSI